MLEGLTKAFSVEKIYDGVTSHDSKETDEAFGPKEVLENGFPLKRLIFPKITFCT